MRSWIVAPVVALCGVGLWGVPPAAATSTVTVTVDHAEAHASGDTSCVNVIYPTCTTPWSGHGLTIEGQRQWEISMIIHSFRPCSSPDWGTWELTATDGSGDGLSGTLRGHRWEPLRMEVTGGTGAYAGAVDTVPGGTVQDFESPEAPAPGLVSGCGHSSVTIGPRVGSLEFTVTLP